MYNLKSMSDEALLGETQKLVKEEREILGRILHHFREIERRRLYCKVKYSSLYEYVTRELGYSEDQAYRRIQAMRLLKELPEIEDKINGGSLNLTHLGMAQSLFKREEKSGEKIYSKQEKLEVLKRLEHTSKREAEKIAVSQFLAPFIPIEKIRPLSDEDVEIRFTAKEALVKKIQRLKDIFAHKNPNIPLSELIDFLCDLGLEKWDKSQTAPARDTERQSLAQLRRTIWKRDQGQCQNCKSQYAVEIDHILPKALGGEDRADNLRLLCRSCNQRAAIQAFGLTKMERYLDSP